MTDAVKHTPGPWRTFNGTDVFPDDGDTEGSRHIADFDMSHGIPAEEQRANARLAAAAPDLLLSGKHLFVKLAEVYQATGQKITDCQAIREWLAAVAKSEGR